MKLLNKTIRSYIVFSVILLLAAIPIFYFALKKMMVQNIDENLIATKTRIIPNLQTAIIENRKPEVDYFGYEIRIKKSVGGNSADSLYTSEFNDSLSKAILPTRLLNSSMLINQEFYSLQIRTPLADKYVLIKKISVISCMLLLLLLLGLLVINRIQSKKIWMPFYKTLQDLHDYRVDQQASIYLARSEIREFNDLNVAIEQLTKRDRQAYISQKEFTENASHEMQSPLAVFQSKLELLMQTKPINEDQAALIADLANESKRMARLNKSLILLTKIENNQFLEKETVSIKETVQKLVDQYEFQIRQKSIRLQMDIEQDAILLANRTLLEILIGNLLSNAIRHTVQNGTISVLLSQHEFSIANNGKESSLNTQKLYQRFQRESADVGSIGLGLEIVKKICELNHYVIEYRFKENLHRFSVKFG